MNRTSTTRTREALRQALRRRARRRRRTIAEIVHQTLEEALIERQADLRAARLLTALLRRRGGARRSRER